jgi:dolichol-phosphate mannosyltransferase
MTQAETQAQAGSMPRAFPEIVHRSGVSLILPAYNESAAIAHSVRDAVAALEPMGMPYEVIVVDDGSRDNTSEVARAAARDLPNVRVVTLPQNAGYGGALRAGFQAARFGFLAFTDADGQFDLSELANLLARVEDADLVCGYRIDRQDPWMRKFYSRGYNRIVRNLLGTRVRDCDCALKVFRREQIANLDLKCSDFFINSEILTKARLAGLTVTEVGVRHFPRVRGESKVSIWHIPPVLQALVRFWWSTVMFPATEPTGQTDVPAPQRWRQAALLALASCLLILPNLGYPLIDPDESRYAEIAREMLDSGDYIVPTRLGEPYLDKPPLLYWLTATSYRWFGISIASARLVPALAGLATIGLIFLLGSRVVGHRAAWFAGWAMLSSCGFLVSSRFVFIDTLLTFLTTAGLLTGCLACRQAKVTWPWWLASALACGLGVLAKGPVACVLCFPPLLICRWLTGLPALRIKHWLSYAAVAGTVVLPWFALIEVHQSGFLANFFWTHHFERFRTGLSHAEPFWYYIPVLLIGMAPCSILFPATIKFLMDAGRSTRSWRSWGLGFLVLSTVWSVLLYSCASCKLAPYMLPVIPLICLIVGTALEAIVSGRVDSPFLQLVRQRSPFHLTLILLAAATITCGVDILALDGLASGRLMHWVGLMAVASIAATVSSWRALRDGSGQWSTALLLALCAMAMGVLDFYPGVAATRSKVRPAVEDFIDQLEPNTPVVCFGLTNEADAVAFHLHDGSRVRSYDAYQEADAAQMILNLPAAVVLSHADEIQKLTALLPKDVVIERLSQHAHIVVGVCVPRTHVAQQP